MGADIYGYPRRMTIYLDIHSDIDADIRVESSVLRSSVLSIRAS